MRTHVLTVTPDTPLREAASFMSDNHAGSVVVVLNGKIQGILTERDVLKTVAEKDSLTSITVDESMTRGVFTITSQSTVTAAMALMREHGIKKLPVIENDRLVGIITATDVLLTLPSAIPELGILLKRA